MSIKIRPMKQEDVEICGHICYEAFKNLADRHNFRPDFPSPEFAVQIAQSFQVNPQIYSIIAENEDGKIVGSNYLWEYDAIRAVGPASVDPEKQSKGAGRKLMDAVIERGAGSDGIRLVQDSFNLASMSLYTSLGFDVKEPLVLIEGVIKGEVAAGIEVRLLHEEDTEQCATLCRRIYGIERTNELRNKPAFLTSFVAVRDGHITAYASAPHFWAMNYAVAETEEDMQAVLTGAGNLSNGQPISFLLPTRQTTLFRWCLKQGMRVVKPSTLMSMGKYEEPHGCFLPSVGY
jgi:predicted N-acetyltransferase YhbS